MVLDGIEGTAGSVAPVRDRRNGKDISSKINVIRYADDFIITGATRELLEDKVKPAIIRFLSERDLSLSEEKTLITRIDRGFDFLGQNVRKYDGKLLIKPSRKNVQAFMDKIHWARRVKPKVIPVTAAEKICNEITVNFSIGKRKQPGGPARLSLRNA